MYRIFFCHSEHFLYTRCFPHVLQKEELLKKIQVLVTVSLATLTTNFEVLDKIDIWHPSTFLTQALEIGLDRTTYTNFAHSGGA